MRLIPNRRKVCIDLLFVLLLSAHPLQAIDDRFTAGDIFVSLSNGNVQWRNANGSLKQVLQTGPGPAKSMAFDADGNLYVPHWYTPSGAVAGNNVAKLDTFGHLVGDFGSNFDCNPTSIQFDVAGNAYIGQADCSGDILKLSPAGNLIARFNVATELRGSGWIALGPDQCTMYYTSAGTIIFRFNVCTNTQLSPLNLNPLPSIGARGIAILPGGGVLVADADEILRLDSSGNIVAHYDAVGQNCWYSLNLDPSGNSFWAGDYCNSDVYKFDLTLGSIQAHFVADPTALVKGVIVYKGSSDQPEPQPSPDCCRMAGIGSVLTAQGVRVTYGFQLRLPASNREQTLDVTWTPAAGNQQHFQLTSLVDAVCVDSPGIDPGTSESTGDTFMARGVGKLNGNSGYTIELVFTDAGDPGTQDLAHIVIRDAAGQVVLSVSGNLVEGNHHAFACEGDCEHNGNGGGEENKHGKGGKHGDKHDDGDKNDKHDKHGKGGKDDDKHGNGGKNGKHGKGKGNKHGNGGKH